MATSTTITALDALAAVDLETDDVFAIVDVHDTTQAPAGSTKKITVASLFTDPTFTGTVTAATLAVSGNATVGGTLGVTGNVTLSAALDVRQGPAGIIVGPTSASSGNGANVRLRDDTGTARWLMGLLGSAAETAWTLYDIVGTSARISVSAAGVTTITGDLSLAGSGVLSVVRGTFAGVSGGTNNILVAGISAVTNGFTVGTDASDNIHYSFLTKGGDTAFAISATGAATFLNTLATGDSITASKSGADVDLVLESSGGSGRNWSLTSSTDGGLYVQDNTATASRWKWDTNGNFLAATDGVYDIGLSADQRPRDLFLSRNLAVAGTGSFGSAVTISTGGLIVSAGGASITGGIAVGVGTQAAGKIYRTAANGLVLQGYGGSSNDLVIVNNANQLIANVANGGTDITFSSNVTADSFTAANDYTSTSGNITLTNGNITLTNGAVNAGSTVQANGDATGNIIMPHRTAPGLPANGAMWTTTAGLFVRINGVTKTVSLS